MIRNILICFVIALPLSYGLFKYGLRDHFECSSLAKLDIEYWKGRALKGETLGAQQILEAFADPNSTFYSQKDALFWFFYLGEEFKPVNDYTRYGVLSKGMSDNDLRAINIAAAHWQPGKSPDPFFSFTIRNKSHLHHRRAESRAIVCGFDDRNKEAPVCRGVVFYKSGGVLTSTTYKFVDYNTGALLASCAGHASGCIMPEAWSCSCPEPFNSAKKSCYRYPEAEREKRQRSLNWGGLAP